jgi:putative membrane protein
MDSSPKKPLKQDSSKELLFILFCGVCMGIADIVPGISGGTIAFIMGFYERLINSIKEINKSTFVKMARGHFKEAFKNISWKFLLVLMIGILLAFITFAPLFDFVLGHEEYRVYLYASFLGLISASVILFSREIKNWQFRHLFAFALGAVTAFVFTGTTFISKEVLYDVEIALDIKNAHNYDASKKKLINVPAATLSAMLARHLISADTLVYNRATNHQAPAKQFVSEAARAPIDLWLMVCGALAISAMLLPGISGSYLLNILGVYAVVIGALADFVHGIKSLQFDADAFRILASMALGIVIGGLFFARFISWLFKHYYQVAIAMLCGFMVGAIRSIWPFWSYIYVLLPLKLEKGMQLQVVEPYIPSLDSPLFQIACLFAFGGFGFVFITNYLVGLASKNTHPLMHS